MDLGNKNTIILGHPWLTRMNPLIDWTAGTVKMRGTPVPRHDDPRILEQRYLLRYLHAMEKDNSKLAARIYAQQRNTVTLLRVLGKDHPHILLQFFFLIVPSYFSFILTVYLLGEVDAFTPILHIFSFVPIPPFVSLTFPRT